MSGSGAASDWVFSPIRAGMVHKSGFCGSGRHERCGFICTNGVRASTRYVVCACGCHDGQPAALAVTLEIVHRQGFDDIAQPLNSSREEIERYVDTVNAILRPREGDTPGYAYGWVPAGSPDEDDSGDA